MNWRCLMWMLPLLAGAAVGAEPPPEAQTLVRPAEPGADTRQWLERQRQGKEASDKAQPLSGPVQEQVYERYRKSFSHEIPERFQREQIRGGSSSR